MRQFAVIFLLAISAASHADAQSFTDQLRTKKQGEGTVTVNQSAAIDELVNNAKLTITPQPSTAKPQPSSTKQQPSSTKQQQPTQSRLQDTKTTQPHNATTQKAETPKTEHHVATVKKEPSETATSEHLSSTKQPETDTEVSELSNVKKVPRVNHKVTGYRVQAYAGGNSRADREKAETIKNKIKARYPELPVYVHFYSPRWICRVGNFRTFEEASSVLKNIKAMGYKQACIVKGKINVGY